MRVAEHGVGNSICDRRPRAAVIRRLVNERIAVIHLMEVHGDVGRARFVARGLNIAHRSPVGKIRNILRDVGPILSAVARDLHESVVRACPDHTRLFRGLRDGENRARIFHADVVGSESAGDLLPALVVAGQVGADDLPAIPTVRRDVDILAAHVNFIVIVRRNRNRELPVESVLCLRGAGSGNIFGPDLDLARLVIPFVEARYGPAYTARACAAGPDNVVVHRIWRGEAAFTPGHRMPDTARDGSAQAGGPATAAEAAKL